MKEALFCIRLVIIPQQTEVREVVNTCRNRQVGQPLDCPHLMIEVDGENYFSHFVRD